MVKINMNIFPFANCDLLHFFSVNTTVEGTPFKITREEAKDIINKTPAPGSPKQIDPIGKYKF